MSKYKDDIIRLRKQGKSYREIENELGCSRGNISYHCKQQGLEDIGKKKEELSEETKQKIRKLREEKTISEVSEELDIGETTVVKYSSNKKDKQVKREHPGSQNTKHLGDVSEMKIATRLMELGYSVLNPIGDNDPYDLVFEDENGELQKVQCKTGRTVADGRALKFSVSSQSRHKSSERYTYHGQIDYFGVYYPENQKAYLVPFDEVSNCSYNARLRIEASKNNQSKRVRFAKEFKL